MSLPEVENVSANSFILNLTNEVHLILYDSYNMSHTKLKMDQKWTIPELVKRLTEASQCPLDTHLSVERVYRIHQ